LDLSEIDLITRLYNLRKLFRFACGRDRDVFRIDIQLVGTTFLMNRFGNDMTIANGTQSDASCGHVFQEYATSCCPYLREMQATSHHRILRYNFMGLEIVVQHEVDAYVCNCHTDMNEEGETSCSDNNAVTVSTPSTSPDTDGSLRERRHGSPKHLLDAPCIAEIKTRKARSQGLNNKDWLFSQLWFSHTHNMLLGYYEDRVFNKVTETAKDMSAELLQWQKKRKDAIRAVAGIVRTLSQTIRSGLSEQWGKASKFAFIRHPHDKTGCLKLYVLRDDYRRKMIPMELEKKLQV
jgi:hypothetical protein